MSHNQQLNPRLMACVDFIFKEAEEFELDALEYALSKRRGRPIGKVKEEPMGTDFARKTASQLMKNVGLGDNPGDMAKKIVKQMLGNYSPAIPPEQIDLLTDYFVDGPATPGADELKFMVLCFLDYSFQRIPSQIEVMLRKKYDNWPEYFFQRFPQKLQEDVRAAVLNKIPPEQVVNNINSYL